MTLTLDLTPELAARLRDKAAREGLEPERYALQTLTEDLRLTNEAAVSNLPEIEAELIRCIHEALPLDPGPEYHALVAKCRAGTLTPDEYSTLITLSDQREEANAQRLEMILELARLRGTTLEAQMQALGIPRYTYEK